MTPEKHEHRCKKGERCDGPPHYCECGAELTADKGWSLPSPEPAPSEPPKLTPDQRRDVNFTPTVNDVVQFPDGHLEDVLSVDVESLLDLVTTTGSEGFFPVYLHDNANGITRFLRASDEIYEDRPAAAPDSVPSDTGDESFDSPRIHQAKAAGLEARGFKRINDPRPADSVPSDEDYGELLDDAKSLVRANTKLKRQLREERQLRADNERVLSEQVQHWHDIAVKHGFDPRRATPTEPPKWTTEDQEAFDADAHSRGERPPVAPPHEHPKDEARTIVAFDEISPALIQELRTLADRKNLVNVHGKVLAALFARLDQQDTEIARLTAQLHRATGLSDD